MIALDLAYFNPPKERFFYISYIYVQVDKGESVN